MLSFSRAFLFSSLLSTWSIPAKILWNFLVLYFASVMGIIQWNWDFQAAMGPFLKLQAGKLLKKDLQDACPYEPKRRESWKWSSIFKKGTVFFHMQITRDPSHIVHIPIGGNTAELTDVISWLKWLYKNSQHKSFIYKPRMFKKKNCASGYRLLLWLLSLCHLQFHG